MPCDPSDFGVLTPCTILKFVNTTNLKIACFVVFAVSVLKPSTKKMFATTAENKMKLFNEFGNPIEEVLDKQKECHDLAMEFLSSLVERGASLGDIRGVTLFLMGGIQAASSDLVLKAQRKLRENPVVRQAEIKQILSDIEDEVRGLVQSSGMYAPAVKLVRERTGMGLKEAKDYVESVR